MVLIRANGNVEQTGVDRLISGLTDRNVKYIANRAAKNISSLPSQMMVPDGHVVGPVDDLAGASRCHSRCISTSPILAGLPVSNGTTPESVAYFPNLGFAAPQTGADRR